MVSIDVSDVKDLFVFIVVSGCVACVVDGIFIFIVVVGVDISGCEGIVPVDMFSKVVVLCAVVGVDISAREVVVSVVMFDKLVVRVVKEVVIPVVVVSVGVSSVKEVCGFTVVSCFVVCDVEDVVILEVVSVVSTVSKNVDFIDMFDDCVVVSVAKEEDFCVAMVVVGASVVKIVVALTVVVDFGGGVVGVIILFVVVNGVGDCKVGGFTVLFQGLVVDCCVNEVVVSVGTLVVKLDVVSVVVPGVSETVVEVRVVLIVDVWIADGLLKGVKVVFTLIDVGIVAFAEEETDSMGVETEVEMGVDDTDNFVIDA